MIFDLRFWGLVLRAARRGRCRWIYSDRLTILTFHELGTLVGWSLRRVLNGHRETPSLILDAQLRYNFLNTAATKKWEKTNPSFREQCDRTQHMAQSDPSPSTLLDQHNRRDCVDTTTGTSMYSSAKPTIKAAASFYFTSSSHTNKIGRVNNFRMRTIFQIHDLVGQL